jgi:hypothetical protein
MIDHQEIDSVRCQCTKKTNVYMSRDTSGCHSAAQLISADIESETAFRAANSSSKSQCIKVKL